MKQLPSERLDHIKHHLRTIPIVALATVSDDGTPLNSPVFGAFNDKLHFFWSSSPQSQHSRNINSNGQVFLVLFNSTGELGGGLYMAARAEQLDDSEHIAYAHQLTTTAKKHHGMPMANIAQFSGNGPQRFYRATPETMWVNASTKDEDGSVIYDQRVEVSVEDLQP